jgi:teichuronic acid biosynthesis glycosyltransferase TuaG
MGESTNYSITWNRAMNDIHSTPIISVIVTTYNRKILLEETIRSILNQSEPDFELLVIDNHSDYNFIDFMDSFKDPRIKAFQNTNNGIIAVNRNYGIKRSKGVFIAFCDDDDIWNSDRLEKAIDCFEKDKTIGMVSSKEILIDENGRNMHETTQDWIEADQFISFEQLYCRNSGSPSATMIKAECIKAVGLFDESQKVNYIEDYQYWLRFILKFKIFYLNKILGGFRVHNQSHSKANFSQLINLNYYLTYILRTEGYEVEPFLGKAMNRIMKNRRRLAFLFLKEYYFREALVWSALYLTGYFLRMKVIYKIYIQINLLVTRFRSRLIAN